MRRSDLYFALLLTSSASLACLPAAAAIDARVRAAMAETCANGMAIAVIDDGRVAYVQAYGARNAKGDPLQTDTVMYGASLTKTVMAYSTLTLVDQGKLDLDAPLADYLDRPLISYGEGQAHMAKYGPYRDLAGDERWRTITARMALTHSTGFHNFWSSNLTRNCASTSIPVHATAIRAKASACCSSRSSREPGPRDSGSTSRS
jgi:CubicO group peptidase (beta-lactamase class C family)